MAIYFPEELFPQLLVKLPVKSLLRFRCVSKSWNSLITSPGFISAHIHHNTDKNRNALVRCYYTFPRYAAYTLHSNNKNLDALMELDFPFKNTYEIFYIVGCANGVICLMDSYRRTNTVLLWNPMIRSALIVPKPNPQLTTESLTEAAFGFGFDSLNNDYKFVRIYNLNDGTPTMDIFRLSTLSWTYNHNLGFVPTVRAHDGCYLKGALYWVAHDHKYITRFDLGTETFTKVSLPIEFETYVTILVWLEQLSVYEIQASGGRSFTLWVMKDDGDGNAWIKYLEMQNYIPFGSTSSFDGRLFERNQSNTDANVVVYEPEAREIRRCNLQFPGDLLEFGIFAYVESLVLLREGRKTDEKNWLDTCSRAGGARFLY